MPDYTSRLALAKPRGGSSGSTPAEPVDIDVLNGNFDKLDAAVGATICTSTTRPATPFTGQIIRETDTGGSYVWSGSWLPLRDMTNWVTPATETGANNTPTTQYCKVGGIVYLTGKWVPSGDSTIMFRLPAGFRPMNTTTFWCERGVNTGPAAKIEIQSSSGSVIYRPSASGTGPIDFGSISFRADG